MQETLSKVTKRTKGFPQMMVNLLCIMHTFSGIIPSDHKIHMACFSLLLCVESKELKLYDPGNDDTHEGMPMLKQIAIKVEHVEKRLDTIINCLQRKFPKTFIEIEEGKERQRESVIFPKPWDKSPALHPKPTNGSLMREIHCRRRCNNKSESLEENKFSRRNHSVFQQQRPIFSSFPGVLSNEDDVEQRVQALERLVVLLKRKIMTRINSKRKHKK